MTAEPIRCVHVIVPEPDGSVGGADMHVRDLAATQATRGSARPVVFATLSHSFARRLRDVGVDCVSTAGHSPRTVLPALRRLIARQGIEIVHSHGYEATWWAVAALATLRRPPPLVVTCHGWIETTPMLKAWSALDRLANRYASGVIVVSDELIAPALRSTSRARVFALVPNGVPPGPRRIATAAARAATRERWGLPTGVPLVGAMGRLAQEKRHDVFIDASRIIAAANPNVWFVIAGGGPLRAQLARRVEAAGLSERLHLLGVVDDPQALLAELAVVVQPSDVETTSRVVLEAMMQARPIVATDVGGMSTLLRHGMSGVLVSPRDPARIAAEVIELLANADRAARLGESARRAASAKHTAEAMADGVDDVYRGVLGRRAERPDTWIRA